MALNEFDRKVIGSAWDPVRLWELRADYPDVSLDELKRSICRLMDEGLLELVPTNPDVTHLTTEEAHAYVLADGQWLNMVERRWPERGEIHELLLTVEVAHSARKGSRLKRHC